MNLGSGSGVGAGASSGPGAGGGAGTPATSADPGTSRRLRRLAESVRAAIERALVELSDARPPSMADALARARGESIEHDTFAPADALAATDALREATAQLSRFLETEHIDAAAVEKLEHAMDALRTARERLPDTGRIPDRLARLSRWLGRAFELAIAQVPLRAPEVAPPPPPEMLASRGVPRAHHVNVPAPRLLARETEDDDDDDDNEDEDDNDDERAENEGNDDTNDERERERGAARASQDRSAPDPAPEAAAEAAQCRAIARECFEDIGSMGNLRKLRDEERWLDAEPFEERLLANLDAAVALENPLDPRSPSFGLVTALYSYATEWDVPDLGRAFALAFTACCLASETALRWVVLALRRAHPRVLPAFVDALSLGSNEAIDRTLAELCDDDDPAVVSVALSAATRRDRGELPGALLLIAHPRPEIACAAIALVARANPAASAPLLARFTDEEPAIVGATAAAALVTLGDPRGATHLRALLAPGLAIANDAPLALSSARRLAFETLCLLGDPADIALLAATAGTSEDDLPWLGWHGFPDPVPAIARALVDAAAGLRFESALRLASALERILGPGAPAPHGAASYEAEVGEWVITREKERPIEPHRLRFGRRWTAAALASELAAPDTPQGARRVLARELPIATHGRARIDVEGWVASQRLSLRRAREITSALS